MSLIFHITPAADWDEAKRRGAYAADSLSSEGFIHCSDRHQVIEVANRLFRGRRDLLLLTIDRERLSPDVRYENLEGGSELYPHVYGAIAVDAVVDVAVLTPGEGGRYTP